MESEGPEGNIDAHRVFTHPGGIPRRRHGRASGGSTQLVMKTNTIALALILVAALWRIGSVFAPALSNIAPITALAFCGAVYFTDRRLWLVPFAGLMLSDVWLNHYHAVEFGYTWSAGEMLLRLACIAAALGVGRLVARRRNALTLLGGALGSALIFYVGTNTASWATDPYYAKTIAGWGQALTVGHPEFPCTLWFFRNTLLGDLLFTGLFVLSIKLASARKTAAPTRSFLHV